MKHGINLIPSHVLIGRKRMRRARAWIGIDALAALGVGAFLVAARPASSGLADRLASERSEVEADLAAAQDALARTTEALRTARAREAVARRTGARPDFTGLLHLLGEHLDDRAMLHQVLIAPVSTDGPGAAPGEHAGRSQYSVLVTGLARSVGIVSEYVLRLDESGYFSSIGLTSTTGRDVGGSRAVDFRLIGALSDAPLASAEPMP